jgi:hypothetical protein
LGARSLASSRGERDVQLSAAFSFEKEHADIETPFHCFGMLSGANGVMRRST